MTFYVYAKSILKDSWGTPDASYPTLSEAADHAEEVFEREGWWTQVADDNGVVFAIDYRLTEVGEAYNEAYWSTPKSTLSTEVAPNPGLG